VSTTPAQHFELAVIGAGVVGCAVAQVLALGRRGVEVVLLKAEADPARGASGTNSGILQTEFDSTPGELETDLILASSALRDPVLRGLGISVLPCGAPMGSADDSQRGAVEAVATRSRLNGVQVLLRDDALELRARGLPIRSPSRSRSRRRLSAREPSCALGPQRELRGGPLPKFALPWWWRTADYRGVDA